MTLSAGTRDGVVLKQRSGDGAVLRGLKVDGSVIKAAALALAGQQGGVAQAQQQIVANLLDDVRTGHALPTIIGILAEGTAKFSAAERVAQRSAYQYASRLKSIVGACLFAQEPVTVEEKIIPPYRLDGDVNVMYTEAVKALRVRDLDWKGEQVSVAKAAKAAEKLNTRLGVEMYKQSQIAPEATMADLKAAVEASVSEQQAVEMLETIGKRAEKFAERMLKDQGQAYALEFATALLSAVRAQQ